MPDGIINVPKNGKDLLERMGKRAKPLPLNQYTKTYLAELYDNPEYQRLALSFNGENTHGSVKNDNIVLAAGLINLAKERGDKNIPDHAGRVANALNHNRRQGGIGPKQLLAAAAGEPKT